MASSSSKMTQIYIGVGVVAVLGGLYWMNVKKENANTNMQYSQGNKNAPPQIKVEPEKVDRLTLKAKDKPEIVLEKKDGNWSMLAPTPGARIQKSAVDEIVNGLKGLTFKDPIAKGQEQFAGYELDEGHGIHVVASGGGVPIVDLWLGKQASRGQLARIGTDASGQIWSVSGISSFAFDKAPKDLRDKKVWDLVKDNVVSVDLHDGKGTFTFSKNLNAGDAGPTVGDATTDAGAAPPAWLGTFEGKPIKDLEVGKVDDLVNAFALGGVLNAEDFGDGKSDTETGLGSADATTITLRTKEGAPLKIVMGKTEGTRRYSRKEGDTTVYLLSEGPSGWADVGLDKFVPAPKESDAGVDGGGGPKDAGKPAPKK
jgi:hypothetical protein